MNFLYSLKTNLIKRSSRDKDEVFHTLLYKGLNNKTLEGILSSASFMPCKLTNLLSRRIVASWRNFSPDQGKIMLF